MARHKPARLVHSRHVGTDGAARVLVVGEVDGGCEVLVGQHHPLGRPGGAGGEGKDAQRVRHVKGRPGVVASPVVIKELGQTARLLALLSDGEEVCLQEDSGAPADCVRCSHLPLVRLRDDWYERVRRDDHLGPGDVQDPAQL